MYHKAVIIGVALLASSFHAQVLAVLPEYPEPPPAVAVCMKCHASGDTAMPQIYPKLAGQHADYIVRQIHDFQAGRRKDPVMSPIAGNLDQQSLKTIAAYFSQQAVVSVKTQGARTGGRGHELYGLHRCYLCHHSAIPHEESRLPRGPVIAGQNRDYLVKAMQDIKSGKRPADVFELMHRSLDEVTVADIKAMADYISTHTPTELRR